MNTKNKRAEKSVISFPMTSTEKSRNRYAELLAAAKRDGFETSSEAITAWKNGEYKLVKVTK